MKFKKLFYDASINLKAISLQRLILGVFIGLFSSVLIYSFICFIQEVFRVVHFESVNFGFQNSQSLINTSDRFFYNFFFAAISIIFGNSIAILYVFSRPNKALNRLNTKRKRILNDQVFFGFNFFYWFNEIGITFGVFSMCCMDFGYIPYFKPFAYLLLIVLYLESWKNLSVILKKNRYKIQLFHFLITLILTLGLSQIHIIDYNLIDKLSLDNNPIIELPNSDFYSNEINRPDLEIKLKLKLDKNNNLEILTKDKFKISLSEVVYYISKERATKREELFTYIKARILANKNLNIKYIKMLEAELYAVNIRYVTYEIYNENLFKSRLENGIINKKIIKPVLKPRSNSVIKNNIPLPPRMPIFPKKHSENFKHILIEINHQTKINGLLISKENLIKEFTNYINAETLFIYNYSENTTYQDYITVLSSHNAAAKKLREKEQTVFIENVYDTNEQYNKEQYNLESKYPIYIDENLN